MALGRDPIYPPSGVIINSRWIQSVFRHHTELILITIGHLAGFERATRDLSGPREWIKGGWDEISVDRG